MTDQFVAEIRVFAFNFAPRGWAQCDGQLLPISQNTALFSLLGTTYGGDGRSTFALPNLQGSMPMGPNPGGAAGLSQYDLGQAGGVSAVTLLASEIPAHTHRISAAMGPGDVNSPADNIWAGPRFGRGAEPAFATSGSPVVTMSSKAVNIAGGNQPHNNLPPFVALNFCIALSGIFPPRW